ncbi:MAG: RnfABCDGE type electron transport complex subunit D [Chloroflexia bacterium]
MTAASKAISNENWWSASNRLAGLRRFAVAITVLNLLGHTLLGFEQSWAQPLVSLGVAYGVELLLEWIDARVNKRKAFYVGGPVAFIDFLLSAHITGLAVSMLLYANDRLLPVAFASAVAIASKRIFRVPAGNSTRHFFNPSNLGITATLLAFPWVGIAPPYMFTENLDGVGDWILPAIIVISGSFINYRFTRKLPLIAAWVLGFIAQGVIRSLLFGTTVNPPLVMMTGLAFVLYTFYMVTDPATTPSSVQGQVGFGLGVAAVYGLLVSVHIVFGLFFALSIVCAIRGVAITIDAWNKRRIAAQGKAEKLEMAPSPVRASSPSSLSSVSSVSLQGGEK